MYNTAFFAGSLPKVQYHILLPGASSCECLRSVSMRFSVLWRGSTLCCVLERRKKLFVAMPAFDTARFLPTFLRHLARVPLSFSKTLPHLLLCNGGLALFYSLHFNPTLSVSGKRDIFCSILVLWRHGSQCWPHLSTSWTLATTEREPSWILGRDTKVFLFFSISG